MNMFSKTTIAATPPLIDITRTYIDLTMDVTHSILASQTDTPLPLRRGLMQILTDFLLGLSKLLSETRPIDNILAILTSISVVSSCEKRADSIRARPTIIARIDVTFDDI